MKRRRFALVLSSVAILLLSGCGGQNSVVMPSSNDVIPNYNEEGGDKMIDYSSVSSIRIKDENENAYQESLDITVKDETVIDFVDALIVSVNENGLIQRKTLYCLELCDNNNAVIDTVIVDTFDTVSTMSGKQFRREGRLDEVLSQIEQANQLSKDLQKRVPGSDFFYDLKNVNSGYFRKNITNSFEDDINAKLSNDVLQKIIENKDGIQINTTAEDRINVKYVIVLNNQYDNTLYTLHIDAEKNVYTNWGYRLSGTFIEEWVSEIIDTIDV